MNEPIFKYDELSDTTYIFRLRSVECGTGIELNDIFYCGKSKRTTCSRFTLFNYSRFGTTDGNRFSQFAFRVETYRRMMREISHRNFAILPVQEILSLSANTPSAVRNDTDDAFCNRQF